MLATTSVLVKTDEGREALSARRHDLQMRQRHLLILINGARTIGELHQLLADWHDLDDLLTGLHDAGMVDVLGAPADSTPDTAPVDEHPAPHAPDTPFDPVAYFNQPIFEDTPVDAAMAATVESVPPLTGMTLGLQTQAAAVGEVEAANEPATAPPPAVAEPTPAPPPATAAPSEALADVLPNVIKVELMRLALLHFGPAAGTVMPLLRTCAADTASLCDTIAACSQAVMRQAGEHAAARFVDDALRAMARHRG